MVNIRTPWVFHDLVEELDRMNRSFGTQALAQENGVGELSLKEDEATLTLDLPGVEVSDLELTLENDGLRIDARRHDLCAENEEVVLRERTYGEFSHSYRLPWPVKEEGVDAEFVQGVLHLRLKRAPEAAPRQIHVKTK